MSRIYQERESTRKYRLPSQRPGPKGGKRDRNRQDRIQSLCRSGLKLFLASGIEGVTIDDIVGEAGVAKGSFYLYFKDKTELTEAILATMGDDLEKTFQECEVGLNSVDSSEGVFAVYQVLGARLGETMFKDVDVTRLYLQECRAPAVGARKPIALLNQFIDDRALELSEVAHRHKLLRPIQPKVSALAVVGAVEKLLFRTLQAGDLGDPLSVANDMVSLVLDGLRIR
ncbi:MAG: TetR/AcrR family transcriptional regulator [Planctomycetota bacterium]|nr:TetR/AcrR family transcriptional regulator [Planctomycetota bacterium]